MWLLIIALAEAQRTQRDLFFLPLRSWRLCERKKQINSRLDAKPAKVFAVRIK